MKYSKLNAQQYNTNTLRMSAPDDSDHIITATFNISKALHRLHLLLLLCGHDDTTVQQWLFFRLFFRRLCVVYRQFILLLVAVRSVSRHIPSYSPHVRAGQWA